MANAACSVSFPIASMVGQKDDDDVTGSIGTTANQTKSGQQRAFSARSVFPSAMTPEDWRRASSALSVALDPQGNGAPARWDNAQSGSRGSFTPSALPVVDGARICRTFRSSVQREAATATLEGKACKEKGEDWVIVEAKPSKA